jgi:hypothetical protein
MATAFLEEALTLTQDPEVGLVDRVAALRAAHLVREDLPAQSQLARAQRELAGALEALGDIAAALDVAATALNEWHHGLGDADRPGRGRRKMSSKVAAGESRSRRSHLMVG